MGIFTGGWNPFRTPIREAVGGITGSPYLAGKEGWLPDFKLPDPKIKGKPVSEVFSAEGYKAGGEWYRKAATSRLESFGEGLFGTVEPSENGAGDDSGYVNRLKEALGYDDMERWLAAQAEAAEDAKATAAKFYEDMLAKGKEGVDLSGVIPEGFGVIPEGFGDMSGIGEGIAEGMTNMGAMLAQAMAGFGQMPQMPSFTDDEGKPDLVLIGALGAAGLGALYILKKV